MSKHSSDKPTLLTRRQIQLRALTLMVTGAVTVLSVLIPPAVSAQTTVNMERLVVAAMVDPPKSGTGITPGAGAHVESVERALSAKGLLSSRYVDGHFGSSTISAYAQWQRNLGYSGLDANGLPGPTSLRQLGSGRFNVTRVINTGSRWESYGGKRVNTRTKRMLAAADAKVSWSLVLTQGSYTSSNPGSAGTHDGGGVVDISVSGMSATQRWKTVKALRDVGFAAWLRTPAQGFAYHIHAVAVADTDMSRTAQAQVHDYYFGRNGLRGHAGDNTPSSYRSSFTWWEQSRR
ncbi:peptidoglycan-binding protein [Microbulbifer rhizosphaerae]|uniref:Peptidoglycan binding domain-containing protein n=1 Tax=Microbulbifer rhizosphaerae TaxID=1562603 RepID=A0A7W4WCN4_9GAMM|nr:peptidoglycan-binding protein [Microbulbifer rhizosphaerae]MBB3061760.1 hypothetical protein [Microbulbifer rhizosphaerae]